MVRPNFEEGLLGFLFSKASVANGCLLDVGANGGVFSATIARGLAERGTVIAFEADPKTAERAAATFALNNLDNACIFSAAVSDHTGVLEFFRVTGQTQLGSTSRIDFESQDFESVHITCCDLGGALEKNPPGRPVTFIKIDVEGGEPAVLRGADRLIQRDRPAVFFEYFSKCAKTLGWTAEELTEQLAKVGYTRFTTVDEAGEQTEFPAMETDRPINIFCELA
jgi:FkbM family methyltransferase